MKINSPLKDLTLVQIVRRFDTDAKARAHLEAVLWKDGIVCPHCQSKDQAKFSSIAANPAKKVRAGLRYCSNCKSQFTVTIDTIFEDSKIPLHKWLIAYYLICSSKKGIAALALQRFLEIGCYGTALFMSHRIRHALREVLCSEKLEGIVEADEAYVGGVTKGKSSRWRDENKTIVMAMVQRGGRMRSKVMPTVNGANLKQAIRANVKTGSEIHTDASFCYRHLGEGYTHKYVNHSAGEYSRHEPENVVSTCGVESFFSLLKRGVVGTFHHVSAQHLPLYLAEFEHRHNCRKMTDGERTDLGLTKAAGKRLIYKNQ
jgi:transposase-like protein